MAARIAATLLACAAGLVAADDLGGTTYSWDELQRGKDIHEDIYNSLSGGEFDEWRLGVTIAPVVDRIQLKSQINGVAYPGPSAVETDRAFSDPFMAPGLSLAWVLGDFDRADQGWYYALGLDYTRRQYHILYAIGTESNLLTAHQLGVAFEPGYMWYLNPTWRVEVAPRLAAGLLWSQMDSVDMNTGMAEMPFAQGVWVEAGGRAALAWHPSGSQAWHIGLSVDYRTGYSQTIFKDEGTLGTIRTEARMWWYGFGYSLYYGHRF